MLLLVLISGLLRAMFVLIVEEFNSVSKENFLVRSEMLLPFRAEIEAGTIQQHEAI